MCLFDLTGVSVLIRNVGSCCPLKGRAEAVTRWTATSCVRAAALAASRTSQPKSPLTANKSLLRASAPPFQHSDESTHSQHITHYYGGDRKCPCFAQTREVLVLFFLGCADYDINFAIVPSVGIQL